MFKRHNVCPTGKLNPKETNILSGKIHQVLGRTKLSAVFKKMRLPCRNPRCCRHSNQFLYVYSVVGDNKLYDHVPTVLPNKLVQTRNPTVQRHKKCYSLCRWMPTSSFFSEFLSKTSEPKYDHLPFC